ncbi:hypothetical protein C9427_06090 [Mesorhizobium helmanticense]|uniref:Uncharacterized protein n=1 Tax=Mesorhizobium helmanticense TaxID=1776423 RepID=A0A2T4J0C9_9HYPH|nr:hypothetical protein C9427_06090 [Mesorhizobium helmanticense]
MRAHPITVPLQFALELVRAKHAPGISIYGNQRIFGKHQRPSDSQIRLRRTPSLPFCIGQGVPMRVAQCLRNHFQRAYVFYSSGAGNVSRSGLQFFQLIAIAHDPFLSW